MKNLFKIIFISLFSLVIALGCEKKAGPGAIKTESGETLYTGMSGLPAWSKIVFSLNAKTLFSDPEYSKFLGEDKEYQKIKAELKEKAGIDIETGIISIVGGVGEIDPENLGKEPDFAVFIEGNYDEAKLTAYIKDKAKEKQEEVISEKVKDFTVLSSTKSKDKMKIALIKGKSVLIASATKLDEILGIVKSGGSTVSENGDLQNVIKSIDGNIFWSVFQFTPKITDFISKQGENPSADPQLKKLMDSAKKLKFIYLFLTKNGEAIQAEVGAQSVDESAAKEFKTLVDGYKTLLAMVPMAQGIAEKIQSNVDGNTTKVSISTTKKEIEEKVKSSFGGMTPPVEGDKTPSAEGDKSKAEDDKSNAEDDKSNAEKK